MSELTDDPIVNEIREEIAAADRAFVELVNRRIVLVQRMKARKEEIGAGWVDPSREQQMLDWVASINQGPVSQDGLAELYRKLVALGKRDVYGV
jgi:chorismate mutase